VDGGCAWVLFNVSSTHGVEIPHPNPSPPGRGAKTLILRVLPLAQFGRGGWGVRAIELTLFIAQTGRARAFMGDKKQAVWSMPQGLGVLPRPDPPDGLYLQGARSAITAVYD
jgi:hypothetical protein